MQRPPLWKIPQPDYNDAQIQTLRNMLDTRLQTIAQQQHGRIVQMSSLAVEDMIISEAIARLHLPFDIAVIDTGMLNIETSELIQTAGHRFGRHLRIYRPLTENTERLIAQDGKFGFYESIEKRRACCTVRKSEPLTRALKDAAAWLTGQRRAQSITRAELSFEEQDRQHGCAKFNPIFDFSEDDVWALAHHAQLPLNSLYHRGYPSIGCAPCSKPVRHGEDIRSGRWWWENADSKECGLHR